MRDALALVKALRRMRTARLDLSYNKIDMRDVSRLGTSLPCNFTLTRLSLERNPFENDGALISTACLELGPPPLGDGGHPRGMDRHILWNHRENALY